MASDSVSRLAGKHAVVTGGAGGIGACLSRRLVEEGAHVTVVDIDATALSVLESDLGLSGLHVSVAEGDVSDDAFVREVVAGLPAPADVLVNGAAIRTFGSVLELDSAFMERHFRVNTIGPALWVRAVAQRLIDTGRGGSIVNLTSLVAHRGFPRNAAYAASKAAVLGYTRCAAMDLAPHGIRVNCVAPGPIRTRLTAELFADPDALRSLEMRTPLGRVGEPHELSGAVVFLASDDSAYVTGTTVHVDGGYSVG